jgi:hypothetical protein
VRVSCSLIEWSRSFPVVSVTLIWFLAQYDEAAGRVVTVPGFGRPAD